MDGDDFSDLEECVDESDVGPHFLEEGWVNGDLVHDGSLHEGQQTN